MKARSTAIVILSILFGYVLLQFIWWEILLVRQTSIITEEKQKLVALNVADSARMQQEIKTLQDKKRQQIYMIVGEGTVFLLLLLFGVHKIRQAYEREHALTTQQNNFFLSVTHELKTPIAATRLQLQTLQRKQLDEQMRSQLLGNALAENERLNHLIDNILLAGRLGAKQVQIKKDKVDLAGETAAVLDRYFNREQQQGRLITEYAGSVNALVDVSWYPSIITNLIENAFRYGGTEVYVSVLSDKQYARVLVADNGPGIATVDRKKIFDKFYRAGNEETRSARGTGLGLYIVKSLMKAHGGSVLLRENQPGGSIFELCFNAA